MGVADRRIGRIAGAQDNVITNDEALAAGLSREALRWRLRTGQWQRIHRGVLLVGPAPPSFAARARAAVLSVGDRAWVGGRSLAVLLGVWAPTSDPIDVTVSGRGASGRPGVVIHRASLVAAEIGELRGIPVTSPARMVCDLAATLGTAELEQLLIDVRVERLVGDRELRAALERVPGRRGSARLRALLDDEAEEGYSRSRAERLLRRLLRDAGLPMPVFNHRMCGFMVDAHWPEARLGLEVDSRRYHGHATAFETDRRRDQILTAAGFRVIRVTWRQLRKEPIAVAVRIGQALAHAAAA